MLPAAGKRELLAEMVCGTGNKASASPTAPRAPSFA